MTATTRLPVLLIAGPTASGKSALALRLAVRFRGTIINADSMQVYHDLSILTARPVPEEERAAPHRLFGHVDAAENYSCGKWLDDAAQAVAAAREAAGLVIVVGGTGLYFKALTQGLANIPAVPPEVKERIRRQYAGVAPAALHSRLAACDPATAGRLRPTDPQRILRALEVFEATGRPLVDFHSPATSVIDAHECAGFFLAPNRQWLAAQIDRRFERMMDAGAMQEIAALAERRLDPQLPIMRAHGVPDLMAYLRGAVSLDAAIAHAKLCTRQYVKRQMTFARTQLGAFTWINPLQADEVIATLFARPKGPS